MPKVIVITGAGVGLGRALARRFAAGGDNVVLLGRTLAKLETLAAELGDRTLAISCDVSSPQSVRDAFSVIAEHHSGIDVMINNAAIFEPALVAEASDEHIVKTIGTNLTGAILCARAALAVLRPNGHIINVSSESVELPFPHLTLYQASKAGLERFSLNLHRELEGTGIRVTNVRAGQMYEDGKGWDVDPAAAGRFFEAALAAGLNLMQRPVSQYHSVVEVFHALVNLPPDVHMVNVALHARAPKA